MDNNAFWTLLGLAMILVGSPMVMVKGWDPDPMSDFTPGVTSFVLRDLLTNGRISLDTGGIQAAVTTEDFPAIVNEGISLMRVRMVPCGCSVAHTHPRAAEILTLISGGPLQVGFVDTKGESHVNILYPGDVTLFPRGMLHFELNVGEQDAHYISALNSQNPGTVTLASALFLLPERALTAAFNRPMSQLYMINSTLSHEIGPSLKKVDSNGCIPGKDITTNF